MRIVSRRAPAALLAFLFLALLPSPSAFAADIPEHNPYPPCLTFTQTPTLREQLREKVYILKSYVTTANDAITAEINDLIDSMETEGRRQIPNGRSERMDGFLDTGTQITRTGDRWMSFLTVSRVEWEAKQTWVSFDARTYDMETASPVRLTDLFDPDSAAWELLSGEIRKQLSAYFSTESADEETLGRLCGRDAIEETPFTLSPAALTLHYRADSLYPDRTTLMHVRIYYSSLRGMMTEEAEKQTDNSRRKAVALTFDDGPAGPDSRRVLEQLRIHGAQATFFCIGSSLLRHGYIVCMEHDSGHQVSSHNWVHEYTNPGIQGVLKWTKQVQNTMDGLIGTRTSTMRAPGGLYEKFINAKTGLSLIQWSVNPGDPGSSNVNGIKNAVLHDVQDGSVVLMHDLNMYAWEYAGKIMDRLEEDGWMCVTVDELFHLFGVELQPDQVYYGCEGLVKQ